MYQTIVAPTDGSRGAGQAVERAIELASLFNAELHLLYVLDTEQYSSDKPDDVVADLLAEEESTAEETLASLEATAEDAGVDPALTAIERGAPDEEILAYAERVDAELVVMGTHGEGGMETARLGSIAEAVSGGLDRPLLLI